MFVCETLFSSIKYTTLSESFSLVFTSNTSLCNYSKILEEKANRSLETSFVSMDYYLVRISIRPCHKVLRIKAVLRYCSWTVSKPWQEVTLSDLIFAIYPWIHGLRGVNVQKITNIYKWNLIKLFQNSAKVAASTNSWTYNSWTSFGSLVH